MEHDFANFDREDVDPLLPAGFDVLRRLSSGEAAHYPGFYGCSSVDLNKHQQKPDETARWQIMVNATKLPDKAS